MKEVDSGSFRGGGGGGSEEGGDFVYSSFERVASKRGGGGWGGCTRCRVVLLLDVKSREERSGK